MPTYLRKFYFNKLLETKKIEKEETEKATKKSKNIQRPNFGSKFPR